MCLKIDTLKCGNTSLEIHLGNIASVVYPLIVLLTYVSFGCKAQCMLYQVQLSEMMVWENYGMCLVVRVSEDSDRNWRAEQRPETCGTNLLVWRWRYLRVTPSSVLRDVSFP